MNLLRKVMSKFYEAPEGSWDPAEDPLDADLATINTPCSPNPYHRPCSVCRDAHDEHAAHEPPARLPDPFPEILTIKVQIGVYKLGDYLWLRRTPGTRGDHFNICDPQHNELGSEDREYVVTVKTLQGATPWDQITMELVHDPTDEEALQALTGISKIMEENG